MGELERAGDRKAAILDADAHGKDQFEYDHTSLKGVCSRGSVQVVHSS